MSIPVLILGASGTGKSTSLREFKRGEIAVINTLGKPLPIREQLEQAIPRRDNGLFIEQIARALNSDTKHKAVMVDDFGYTITEIYMRYTHGAEKLKDQYEVYLSGPQPLLRIENPNAKADRELVVFRDSFGSSIAPLLVQDYKTVTLVDIRYINSWQLERFLKFENQDVLFLYNTAVLNNGTLLK